MEHWKGKVAIVTGASSGIGAAIAKALVQHGLTVVGLARRQERIEELSKELETTAPGSLHALKTDLRKEEDILAAFSWVETKLGGADILVNNAGILNLAAISEGKTEDWRAVLEVNVLAPSICMREFLKSMERRKIDNGHIIVINSVAGHQAEYPEAGMYCGSKFAIRAITKCLRRELAKKASKIKVTSIAPGATDTEIFKGTDFAGTATKIPLLKSEDVAAVVVDSLSASAVSEICEVVLNPVPTMQAVY